MMKQFGGSTEFDGTNYFVPPNSVYNSRDYYIEPDMSAACYFYSIAALTGGEIKVIGVHPDLIQGDIKFLTILEQLGCSLETTEDGVKVKGPTAGKYNGIEADLNDFSDQTMTLATLLCLLTRQL